MLQYIIQTVLFQLIFLLAYDLFHKKDTFFTVNRVYLLISSLLSMILPLLKVKTIQETIPDNYVIDLPTVFIGERAISNNTIEVANSALTPTLDINWWIVLYTIGVSVMIFLFIRKALIIRSLKKNSIKGSINNYPVRVLKNSKDAFTFWNTIYVGDQLSDTEKNQILVHEIVHLKQKHTLDLIWFEIIKIFFWFNPMVYIYHSRIVTLHEYISDASAIKLLGKQEYYEQLLNANFQTKNVKFANNFFNHKLLKKRIIMLQKTKSKANAKLKYLAIVPLLAIMVTFTAFSQKAISLANISSEKIKEEIQELTNKFSKAEENARILQKEKLAASTEVDNTNNEETNTKVVEKKSNPAVIQKPTSIQTTKDSLSKSDQKIVKKLLEIKEDVIKNGKSFASRAVLYSEDPGSKGNGGYYLVNKDDPFHESFKNVVFSLKEGEISDPFRTPFGWHILTVEKIQSEGVGIRHILMLLEPEDVPFAAVDKVPTTEKCKDLTDKELIKKCVSDEISQFVNRNFNIKIAEEIGLSGINRIYVRFKINTEGQIVDIQSRAPAPELELEATRVIKLLPKMNPGESKGEKVNVLYSLPIVFKIAPKSKETIEKEQASVTENEVLTESLSFMTGHEVKNGYYLVTNIFKRKNYFERGMANLKKKKLDPKFFRNPKDRYIYVYLERYDTLEEAKKMLFSDFDNRYKGDMYILKIQ
ncbi:peptidylprolyl isomerase [Aquimarina sp. 2201CG14-23]|uniref:peptidylprolyl isomerase n=1 Tax=Aquimarina mycalae TaxID=3040073 RepID=UPI002477D212|nr:peptidylprolyl isomerase [Aquimarina sp. 2201CG14-23]MDH7448003.1 peptidylprolyl isomerase [Aquimarina sp. 2201CG14-23]